MRVFVLGGTGAIGSHALPAEASATRFSQAGGRGVVLRFGLFYGPGARHSEQFLAMARHHVVPLMGRPQSYLSSIHMVDGGAAVVAALRVPAGTYNVVDDEPLTKREFAQALAVAASTRPWVRGPGRLALLLGDRMTSLTRSMRVSNRRFCQASGWQPQYRVRERDGSQQQRACPGHGFGTLRGPSAPETSRERTPFRGA